MSTINSASGDLTLNATGSGNDLNLQANSSTKLTLKADGRGLSQFTAKAWVNFNGAGTPSIRDSHNVSSVSDNGTGAYTVNFDNNLADTSYSFHYCGGDTGGAETTFQLGSISLVSSNRVQLKNAAGTVTDRPYITGVYFGG